jgi:thymidylate synthase ThyX
VQVLVTEGLVRIASHRIASHRIASHRIASHRIASHRIVPGRGAYVVPEDQRPG